MISPCCESECYDDGNRFVCKACGSWAYKTNCATATARRKLPNGGSMKRTHKMFRGQGAQSGTLGGGVCQGRLTITLSGPIGCGKSLVAKILLKLLPLTGVDEVVIVEQSNG